MRFAILGLYNSGSSAIAGMLHRLGANLGPPFWRQRPGRESTIYEADDLGAALRLAALVGLQPDADQVTAAAASVRGPSA